MQNTESQSQVFVPCSRCAGKGRTRHLHVADGVCFGCEGAKGVWVSAKKAAAQEARVAKKAAQEAEKASWPRWVVVGRFVREGYGSAKIGDLKEIHTLLAPTEAAARREVAKWWAKEQEKIKALEPKLKAAWARVESEIRNKEKWFGPLEGWTLTIQKPE